MKYWLMVRGDVLSQCGVTDYRLDSVTWMLTDPKKKDKTVMMDTFLPWPVSIMEDHQNRRRR
jgi:hypothetical protein